MGIWEFFSVDLSIAPNTDFSQTENCWCSPDDSDAISVKNIICEIQFQGTFLLFCYLAKHLNCNTILILLLLLQTFLDYKVAIYPVSEGYRFLQYDFQILSDPYFYHFILFLTMTLTIKNYIYWNWKLWLKLMQSWL